MRISDDTFYKNGSYSYFVSAFSLIIGLNVLSILYYFFNLFITFRVKHYQTNLHLIHQAIYFTCPFTSVFFILDGIFSILEKRQEYNLPFALNFFRIALACPPLFALVAIMIERLFATYYVKDYEKNQRASVGYGIIMFLYIISFFTACIFSYTNLLLVFVGFHLFLNVICYVVSLIIYRINRKYYNENRIHKHSYSLGERYQISENIRLYKFFSHYLFVLAIFPIICTTVTLFDNLDSNPIRREIYSLIFNFSFTLLCFFAPYLTYKMSEPWQNELDIIFMKIGIKKPNRIHFIRENSKVLRGTFGEEINVETSKHTDVYFNQLKTSWNLNNSVKA